MAHPFPPSIRLFQQAWKYGVTHVTLRSGMVRRGGGGIFLLRNALQSIGWWWNVDLSGETLPDSFPANDLWTAKQNFCAEIDLTKTGIGNIITSGVRVRRGVHKKSICDRSIYRHLSPLVLPKENNSPHAFESPQGASKEAMVLTL